MNQHTEATVTSNVTVTTPGGYKHQITMRAGVTEEEIKAQLQMIQRLDKAFVALNWQPANGSSYQPATSYQNGNGKQLPTAKPPEPIPAPSSNGGNVIDCQSLACTIDNGKSYWKISTHRWKFPIIIYPEVLAQYFNPDSLNPMTVYSLTGWRAVYEMNEKGHPKKIVELVKPNGNGNGQLQPQQIQRPQSPQPQPIPQDYEGLPPEAEQELVANPHKWQPVSELDKHFGQRNGNGHQQPQVEEIEF